MVCESINVLGEAISIPGLDGVHDPSVKLPAPIVQHAAVCHLMGERMLEGVLGVRIETSLVEEFGGLQAAKSASKRLVRQVGDRLEQYPGHVLADDGGDLQEAFVFRGEPVNACREDGLHRWG